MDEVQSPPQIGCWNTIGIWGNQAPRCEKLQDVIHCRNCHVYWDAGRRVFEKDVPEDYIEQWTRALANEPQSLAQLSRSIIYFRLGEEWFSLATKIFVEVAQARAIHRIPHQSGGLMQGVVNVGGAVRLCFALNRLLGVNNTDQRDTSPRYGVYQRYLAVQINNNQYVFPVDEVGGVYRYDPQDLKQVPVTIEPRNAELLLGMLDIDGVDVACIDADKLGQAFEKAVGE